MKLMKTMVSIIFGVVGIGLFFEGWQKLGVALAACSLVYLGRKYLDSSAHY